MHIAIMSFICFNEVNYLTSKTIFYFHQNNKVKKKIQYTKFKDKNQQCEG